MVCSPLNQCSYKKLCGNFALCLSSSPTRVNCKLSQDCDSKAKTIEPQRSRSAVAWRSTRSAIPSQRSLFMVSRCSRATTRQSANH